MTLEVCHATPLVACPLTAAHRRATSFSPGLLQVSVPLRLVTRSNVHWPIPATRFSISSLSQLSRETEVIDSSSSIHCILVLPKNKSRNYMPMAQSTTNVEVYVLQYRCYWHVEPHSSKSCHVNPSAPTQESHARLFCSKRSLTSSSDIVCKPFWGLAPLVLPKSSPSESVSELLANVQLPAVGVRSPPFGPSESPDWKSPKSNESSDEYGEGNDDDDDAKVNGSEDLVAAESENGPKASS